jgi:signal transduction histidine kinase/CheY-like chemotaxis protein
MWQMLRVLRASSGIYADFAQSLPELALTASRSLMLLVLAAGVVLTGMAISTVWRTGPADLPLLLVALAGVTVGALFLLSRWPLAAHLFWLAGVVAVAIGVAALLRRPEVAAFFVLLPLAAALLIGWTGALVAEGAVIVLCGWLIQAPLPGVPALPLPWAIAIGVIAALAGALSWAAMRVALQLSESSLRGYMDTRAELEAARAQRLELKQVQEDLIQANRELARLSDRLKALNQVAEEARHAKEQFVANVSHELRTPLNMIIGFAEMILQSSDLYGARLPPALLSDIAAIERNSQHLARLVDDVLDLSQADAGRMTLSKERVALTEIVEAAVTAVRVLYESKGLCLETEIAPDLPEIFCDNTRIRQVLINLLSNAGRFTERGGVWVGAERQRASLVVSVRDTGPGITPENLAKLFEPFQQLDASIRRRHGGSGLGLSISKRFVELHGGKMWVESQVGAGSVFFFSLPLDTPLADEAPGAVRWASPYHEYDYRLRTRRSKAPRPAALPRYIILEQGETLTHQFQRYVEGVEVLPVRDVSQAIEELNRSPAQALVVNQLSAEDGAGLMDSLRDLPHGTPAITCWVPGTEEAARRLGVVRYLIKPIARETLLTALAALGNGVRNVLLVDDNREALQLFSRMIASAADSGRSYQVWQARNGQQALSILRDRRPDAVLLDLVMPGLDGFGVLREKQSDPALRDIPVVVISSRDPIGDPIVSQGLTVVRKGGLSVPDLLACIQATAELLNPAPPPSGQGPGPAPSEMTVG